MRRGLLLVAIAVAVVAVIGLTLVATRPRGEPFAGVPRRTITVDGRRLTVVVAPDRGRGLSGVTDLGDLDGMLFDYTADPSPSRSSFWMRDVLIPLDLAFFGEDGRLLEQLTMPLCPEPEWAAGTCPTYRSPAPFRWALETATGRFVFDVGGRLEP